MATSVIGEEPSVSPMVRSTSTTLGISVAVSSLSSSRPSSSKGASSTTASSLSSSRPSSSKGASSTTTTMKARSEPGTVIIQYTTIPTLFQRIAHATEEIITVHGMPSQEFTKFFEQRNKQEGHPRKFLISLYTASLKCMIITIPTAGHELLHGGIDDLFRDDAHLMGLRYEFWSIGSTTFMDRDADGNITSEGEGDSCRIPSSKRDKGQYPTLVIEAGWSQTLQKLQQKARWWFDKSKGDVKIVLLVKSSPGSNHIRIEKWKLSPANFRQGATNTRAAAMMTPQCVHVVEITRVADIDDAHPNRFDLASYIIIGGPLQLEFIDIFLRQPMPPRERDLIIDNTTLQQYAALFWKLS